MVYDFPYAHEPEVARLDDARVNRSYCHLVNVLSLHAEERVGMLLVVGPHWFQPRVAFRFHGELLEDLPLEEVDLRAIRS